MKLFVAVILAIVFFGAINCEVDFEELEDGLEPSLKELRAAVDAAWELEKRKEEGDLEKRADDDREELMAMVDAALEKLSARKQEEEEAEMNQQAEMMRNAMEKRDGDDEVAELETAPATPAPQKGKFLDACNTLVPNKMLIGTRLIPKTMEKTIQIKGKCLTACVGSDDCVGFHVNEYYKKTKETCLLYSKLTSVRDQDFDTGAASFEKCKEEDDPEE